MAVGNVGVVAATRPPLRVRVRELLDRERVLGPLFIAPARRAGRRKKVLKQRVQAGMSELTGMLTETLSVS